MRSKLLEIHFCSGRVWARRIHKDSASNEFFRFSPISSRRDEENAIPFISFRKVAAGGAAVRQNTAAAPSQWSQCPEIDFSCVLQTLETSLPDCFLQSVERRSTSHLNMDVSVVSMRAAVMQTWFQVSSFQRNARSCDCHSFTNMVAHDFQAQSV